MIWLCKSISRTPQPAPLQSTETQEQQETQNSLHNLAAAFSGEEVPSETVPLHRGESGVLQLPQPHRDPGQDLVSEPQGQGQETAGGRAGEAQAGREAAAAGLRLPLPPERTHGRTVPVRGPERTAACPTCPGTIQWTIWDVLLVLTCTNFELHRWDSCLKKKKNAFIQQITSTAKNVHPVSQNVRNLIFNLIHDVIRYRGTSTGVKIFVEHAFILKRPGKCKQTQFCHFSQVFKRIWLSVLMKHKRFPFTVTDLLTWSFLQCRSLR